MMRTILSLLSCALLVMPAALLLGAEPSIYEQARTTERWQPEPPMVSPGSAGEPPSDAIVLFDGTNLDAWESVRGGEAVWQIDDGAMTVVSGSGDIRTRALFSDLQLHLEWRTPAAVVGDSQGRGNSGVFLMQRYEVQVLDSYQNPTYSNGQAGSIYKQHIPLVNASRGPGLWQSYDIVFRAPRFAESGRVSEPARVTVLHNGVLIQDAVPIQGSTAYVGAPHYEAHGPAAIHLQDHGNPVSFRNIWVRRL